jgi:MFS family permease
MSASAARTAKAWSVVRVAAGNFLEMYDFVVFGYYADFIGRTFFPSDDPLTSLLLSLTTFGAGFLMRPLGAIVLGAYTDRHGRRAGLLLTLGLMSVGTLTLACMPGYETAGLLAPLVVVLGRLIQGFSAGAELGGVSVYLAEIATPGHKGFYVSWQSASQQLAVIFSAVLGVVLHDCLSAEAMDRWGWRIPLLVGCLIVPFLFMIRRSLEETAEFRARRHHPSLADIFRSTVVHWQTVLVGVMLVTMTTVSFYLITVYTPTFGMKVLRACLQSGLVS